MSLDFDVTKYKLGDVCKKGHTYKHFKHWNLRTIRNTCVRCDRERVANWRKANIDYYREYDRKLYHKNPERSRQNSNRWKENNKQRVSAYSANWKRNNRKHCNSIQRNWRQTLKGRIVALRGRHSYRSKKKNNLIEFVNYQPIYNYFNNECCYCGDKEVLTIDHIRPISKGGSHTLHNLATACKSCNSSKNDKDLLKWYNNSKSFYTVERFVKITRWMYQLI